MKLLAALAAFALLAGCGATAVSGADEGATELAPPQGVDTLVLCLAPFEGPRTGRADCAVRSEVPTLTAVTDRLAAAPVLPPQNDVCAIAAAHWDLVWLDDDAVADRVQVPDATCVPAGRPSAALQYAVTDGLLDALRAAYDDDPAPGGTFDLLADANPVAAFCAQRYPDDLAEQPLAFDGVVLGVAPTDPAATPESPGVPFTDVDVLVLETFAGDPGERLVVRSLGTPPPPRNAVGERLLIANSSPFLSACGFTQPYSTGTAAEWRDTFR